MQGYRAKEIIRKDVLGDEAEQFKTIQSLLGLLNGYTCFRTEASLALELNRDGEEAVEEAFNGSQAITVGDDNNLWLIYEAWANEEVPQNLTATDTFACYFIAPKACPLGSHHLQRLISVDGCHTTSFYDLVILIAVGFDGDNRIYPLAWAVVTGENYRSWRWSFRHLQLSYPWISTAGLSVLSDRQKGLIKAVTQVLPLASHYYCIQYLGDNIQQRFGGLAGKEFIKLAYQRHDKSFWKQLEGLEKD